MKTVVSTTVALVLLALVVGAQAQTKPSGYTPVSDAPDPCRREVSRFEDALAYVRTSQGEQAAAQLREKLLPAQLENELLTTQGVCGLARHLREKKLSR